MPGLRIDQLPIASSLSQSALFAVMDAGITKGAPKSLLSESFFVENLISITSTADLVANLPVVSGEYQIPAGKGLIFLKSVLVDKPLRIQSGQETTLVAPTFGGNDVVRLTYVSPTGAMINGTNIAGLKIQNLTFTSGEGVSGLPAQTLFNISNGSNPANWSKWFLFWNSTTENWSNHGLLEGINLFYPNNVAVFAWGGGFECKNIGLNTINTITFANGKNTSGAIGLKLTGVNDRVVFDTMNAFLLPNEKAIKLDTALITSKILIDSVTWNGVGQFFDPTGNNQTHPSVLLTKAPPIPDSKAQAFLTAAGPLLVSGLTQNVFKRVDINFTSRKIERFQLQEVTPSSGIFQRIRYLGIETITANCFVMSNVAASIGAPSVELAIAVNGTTVDYSALSTKIPTGDNGLCAAKGLLTLSNNDYIELFIRNLTNSGNLTVSQINFSIEG